MFIFADENHGGDGPLSIEHPEFSPMVEHWLSAGKELGYEVKDPNFFQKESKLFSQAMLATAR